jgi:hypothetical protein
MAWAHERGCGLYGILRLAAVKAREKNLQGDRLIARLLLRHTARAASRPVLFAKISQMFRGTYLGNVLPHRFPDYLPYLLMGLQNTCSGKFAVKS